MNKYLIRRSTSSADYTQITVTILHIFHKVRDRDHRVLEFPHLSGCDAVLTVGGPGMATRYPRSWAWHLKTNGPRTNDANQASDAHLTFHGIDNQVHATINYELEGGIESASQSSDRSWVNQLERERRPHRYAAAAAASNAILRPFSVTSRCPRRVGGQDGGIKLIPLRARATTLFIGAPNSEFRSDSSRDLIRRIRIRCSNTDECFSAASSSKFVSTAPVAADLSPCVAATAVYIRNRIVSCFIVGPVSFLLSVWQRRVMMLAAVRWHSTVLPRSFIVSVIEAVGSRRRLPVVCCLASISEQCDARGNGAGERKLPHIVDGCMDHVCSVCRLFGTSATASTCRFHLTADEVEERPEVVRSNCTASVILFIDAVQWWPRRQIIGGERRADDTVRELRCRWHVSSTYWASSL